MSRKYHHGNLRAALIQAARNLIAEKGPQGFTLAEAAKLAGVSNAAPYRHFKSKDDLVAALASEGFERFAVVLGEARTKNRDPHDAMIAIGRCYLQFAAEHKGEYMAMFESGVSINTNPEIAQNAARALGILEGVAAAIVANLPVEQRPPASVVAQHVWAMAHGVAELFARGSVGRVSPFPPEDILESGIRLYLKGLGV